MGRRTRSVVVVVVVVVVVIVIVIGIGIGIVVAVAVSIVVIEGLLLVEDAALLGALLLHELVVHGVFLPSHLLLLAVEAED